MSASFCWQYSHKRCISEQGESGGIPHLFGAPVSAYKHCLIGSSRQQQQQQQQQAGSENDNSMCDYDACNEAYKRQNVDSEDEMKQVSIHQRNSFLFIYLKKEWSADIKPIDKRQRDDIWQTRGITIGTVLDMAADQWQDININWVSVAQWRHQLIT